MVQSAGAVEYTNYTSAEEYEILLTTELNR